VGGLHGVTIGENVNGRIGDLFVGDKDVIHDNVGGCTSVGYTDAVSCWRGGS
jgi:hypothetical protein